MYQLHKTDSVVGWVPLDYIDILTIKSALIAYKMNGDIPDMDKLESGDISFINSIQSIINRIQSLEQ
jgi:hypothetical protein